MDVARGRKSFTVAARPEAFEFDCTDTALLVVDMQNDFGSPGGMFDLAGNDISAIRAVVPAVAQVIDAARDIGVPIFFIKMAFQPDLSDAGPSDGPNLIKHAPMSVGKAVTSPSGQRGRILIRDCWNTDIIDEIAPQAGDTIVYKSRFSAFVRTDLHEQLQRRSITNLIVVGCTTSVCVESTVRDAFFHDYKCLLLEDCMAEPIAADAPRSNHEASLLTMQLLFAWIADSTSLLAAVEAQRVSAVGVRSA